MPQWVKNLPANSRDLRNVSSIPGSGRSPGGGHGNPLQYSCLENPMDRRAWWTAVHRVPKRQTRLKQLSKHVSIVNNFKHNIQISKLIYKQIVHTNIKKVKLA